jgi:signal transduction histidine kinase
MKSLFLKIFLWFWLTFLMIGAVLSATIAIAHSDDPMLDNLSSRLAAEARTAVTVYEHEGKIGLKHHFDVLAGQNHIAPYLFNQKGVEVLGRTPPMNATEFVRAMGIRAPEIQQSAGRLGRIAHWHGFVAQQVNGANGQRYTVLFVYTPPVAVLLFNSRVLIVILAQLLVGTAFCYWLARHIANPVVELSKAASLIAEGSLDARSGQVIRQRHDEIGRLAMSFDCMAERIESVVRGQQRLFGDVSHELRSPLTRLSVAEGLLRQCSPEERIEYLDRIAIEVERLDQLIGQLLTLARIDGAAELPRKGRVELNSLVEEVVANGNFEAQTKHCAVTVDFMDECTTSGSREQLRSAIENVVRNAISYSPANTSIEVTVFRDDATALPEAVIQIRDHGPGVPSEHLERIFHAFYRVPTSKGEKTSSAGLGLAITERIVRMHGGTATAANASEGGLVVRLSLPLLE